MKRVLLLMVVSALLVTSGFAQTPAASSNTDTATVKGCVGGSDGNYTVAEDGTRQIFKITTSSLDLKAHLGHEVTLIGHKTSGTVSSGTGDNSFAVTELNMISEHCAAAAAAQVETVSPSSASASTPAVDAAAPAATVSPSSTTASTPPAEATAPAAPVSPSLATVSTPAADAAQPTRPSSHARRHSETKAAAAAAPAATVSPSSETVSPAAADAAIAKPSSETVSPAAADAATAGPSSDTASAPAVAAPAPSATHRAGSLSLLIAFVVLVIVFGTLAPLLLRWRKRKLLERSGTPNLSFINEASSGNKPEPRKVA
jgi:hypothetical protein